MKLVSPLRFISKLNSLPDKIFLGFGTYRILGALYSGPAGIPHFKMYGQNYDATGALVGETCRTKGALELPSSPGDNEAGVFPAPPGMSTHVTSEPEVFVVEVVADDIDAIPAPSISH